MERQTLRDKLVEVMRTRANRAVMERDLARLRFKRDTAKTATERAEYERLVGMLEHILSDRWQDV
jgi:hypothetical protein